MSTAAELEPHEPFDIHDVMNPDGTYNMSAAIIIEFGSRAMRKSVTTDTEELEMLQEKLQRQEAGDQDRSLPPRHAD